MEKGLGGGGTVSRSQRIGYHLEIQVHFVPNSPMESAMKKHILFLAMISLSMRALAANPLVGVWTLQSQSCLSGVKMQTAPGLQTSFTAMILVSETDITFTAHLKAIIDSEHANQWLAEDEKLKTSTLQMPNGPDKEKQLANIQTAEDQIHQLVKGLDCVEMSKDSYSTQGSTISLKTKAIRTTCPAGNVSPVGTVATAEFKLNGNTFIMVDPTTRQNNGCPVGDKVVSTFTRP
jgi:hypothetical protein